MIREHQLRSRLLRLARMTTIVGGGAWACYFLVSTADAHARLVGTLEQVNVVAEAAALLMLRFLMECRLDLASF